MKLNATSFLVPLIVITRWDDQKKEEEEEEEEWETLSIEKELWVQLCVKLELLTRLSLLTGVDQLRRMPPVLFMTCEGWQKGEEEEIMENLDLTKVKMNMLFEGKQFRNVCHSLQN